MENDMDHIVSGIWLGNETAALSKKILDKHNIKYIINATPDIKMPFNDIKYLQIPIHDKEICELKYEKSIFDLIFKAFYFIDEAINSHNGILIHCKRGHHRSANIILFYLVYRYNIGYIKALIIINYIRPKALVRNTCINNWGMEIYKKIINERGY